MYSYDFLTIYDGDSRSSNIIGDFCGNSLPSKKIISSSHELLIRFRTSWYGFAGGFKLEYSLSSEIYRFFLLTTENYNNFYYI